MVHNLCLTRNCLGLQTRIECEIRPLAGGRGLWILLCAAGMAAAQPSAVQAQGPFHGPCAAEAVLAAIASSLAELGYVMSTDPAIWQLHLQAELRRLNGEGCRSSSDFQFRPEP